MLEMQPFRTEQFTSDVILEFGFWILDGHEDDSAKPSLSLIHVWCPGMFDFKGGIQVYSGMLLQALLAKRPQLQYEVFLKHDRPSSLPKSQLSQTQVRYHGAGALPAKARTFAFSIQGMLTGLQQRPDLIICTHPNYTKAAYWLHRTTGIPYWAIAHGIDVWDIQSPSLQRGLRHADRILAVSGYTRDRLLREQDLQSSQIELLPNTVDAERFQIAEKPVHLLKRYGLQADQPIILTVARLADADRHKGYDPILKALPAMREQIPNIRYVLVGKGGDRPRIEAQIKALNLETSVILTGFVPDEDLCDHYNLCDVYAMPSKREGFGIVYLEALACGKPTLGGNQDGAVDALAHGELGVLVNPDDVDEIGRSLVQILQGSYKHPILYQPAILRQQVIERFGFGRFQNTLANYLSSFATR
ncbi:MAG: glycosyltransferase [Elainellaceae cyanobacterium]